MHCKLWVTGEHGDREKPITKEGVTQVAECLPSKPQYHQKKKKLKLFWWAWGLNWSCSFGPQAQTPGLLHVRSSPIHQIESIPFLMNFVTIFTMFSGLSWIFPLLSASSKKDSYGDFLVPGSQHLSPSSAIFRVQAGALALKRKRIRQGAKSMHS
jgi:hypothetical protein